MTDNPSGSTGQNVTHRDSVECWHCLGSGSYSFDLIGDGEGGESTRCFACDGMGRLDLDAVRKLVDDEDRDHADTKTALLKTMEERDAALRMADRWQQACTEAQRERDWWRRDTEKIAAERDKMAATIRKALALGEANLAKQDEIGRAVDATIAEVLALRAERDHWKANHDNAVAIRRAIICRADLPMDMHPERREFVATLLEAVAERDALRQAVREVTDAAAQSINAEARAAVLAAALREIAEAKPRHACSSCGLSDEEWAEIDTYNRGYDVARTIAAAALAGAGNGNGTGGA